MMKLKNPFGDKGGRLLSAIVEGHNISMQPGEERLVPDNIAHKARMLYPFLEICSVEEVVAEEEKTPEFNGEKKKRRSFLNL